MRRTWIMAKGDQIYTIRDYKNTQSVYEHHGIDCGDGFVIHYQKVGKPEISRTSMMSFTDGRPVYIKSYASCFAPDDVLKRAESRLGEKRYHFFLNNCEHFTNWCKTGNSISWQFLKKADRLLPLIFNLLCQKASVDYLNFVRLLTNLIKISN